MDENRGKVLSGMRPSSLDLEFFVIYKDDTTLKQAYGTKEEKNFGDIKLDEVKEFWLGDKNGRYYCVDLENQCFVIEGKTFKVEYPRDNKGEASQGKLVYFRRIRNDFTPQGLKQTVRQCLGLQANIDGVNYQQYIFIEPDGTFTLSQKK